MYGVRCRRSRGCVFSLKYHLVGCPKYRRKVLLGTVIEDLKTLLYQKAAELPVTIEALEVMQDHIHLFVSADPTVSPQRLANQFKGYTSRLLRLKYPELQSCLPSLWSRSDYVGSVGQVSEETVKRYIETQKGT
jgi:putative transposase